MTIASLLRSVGRIATAATICGAPLGAQSVEQSLAVGVAVPTGALGEQRSAGPALRAGLTFGDRQRHDVRLRLELEGAWLLGRAPGASSDPWAARTVQTVSGTASMVLGATGTPAAAPYFVLGMGLQRMSGSLDVTTPRDLIVGVRGGIGLQWQLGRRTMFAEASAHASFIEVLHWVTYLPVVIGMRY